MPCDLIQKLYLEIQRCRICDSTISDKALRKLDSVNLKSEIFILAEAMAPAQVRLSGVNYFDVDGKIGSTGRLFEKFLNKFGYSVYPGKNCVYHSEIVHCFPGYEKNNNRKFIRRPTIGEINRCINQKFIEREIDFVKPKIIFLMGKTSYESFYRYFLKKKAKTTLTNKLQVVVNTKKTDVYKGIPVIPIQHASGANPRFNKMLNNTKLIKFIKEILRK